MLMFWEALVWIMSASMIIMVKEFCGEHIAFREEYHICSKKGKKKMSSVSRE